MPRTRIEECQALLVSTFERYKEKPKWSTLQAMFRLAFQLGYEVAKEETRCNRRLTEREVTENE